MPKNFWALADKDLNLFEFQKAYNVMCVFARQKHAQDVVNDMPANLKKKVKIYKVDIILK